VEAEAGAAAQPQRLGAETEDGGREADTDRARGTECGGDAMGEGAQIPDRVLTLQLQPEQPVSSQTAYDRHAVLVLWAGAADAAASSLVRNG